MKGWSSMDKGMLATAIVATIADVETTKRTDKRVPERNPLLGKHPSNGLLNAGGLAAIAGGTALAAALPEEERIRALAAWAAAEAILAYNNAHPKGRGYAPAIVGGVLAYMLAGRLPSTEATSGLSFGLEVTPDGSPALAMQKKF